MSSVGKLALTFSPMLIDMSLMTFIRNKLPCMRSITYKSTLFVPIHLSKKHANFKAVASAETNCKQLDQQYVGPGLVQYCLTLRWYS